MDIMLQRILELVPNKHGAKKELADAVGFPANLITDWKSGRNKSYPKYSAQIAEYYGVSLDWLSGNSDIKEKPATNGDELTALQSAIMDKVMRLTPEMQLVALAQIEALPEMR